MKVQLRESRNFDEFDAFVGTIGDHDVTVLLPPTDGSVNFFDVMIEPGQACDESGECVDLSEGFVEWIEAHAGELGTFECVV